jgi:hypothetical protein
MPFHRWSIGILAVACLGFTQCAPVGPAQAANPNAKPMNQLVIAGNACGPAAAVNALRYGSAPYQAAARAIPGETDLARLEHVIQTQGCTWSQHVPQRQRWSDRGINAADLTDVINELTAKRAAPRVTLRVPSGTKVLHESYDALARSLRRGFPPVVALRRYQGVSVMDSHFIMILQVPDSLDANASEFTIRYLDPMGASVRQSIIRAQSLKRHSQLIVSEPQTRTGIDPEAGSSQLIMDALIVSP